MLSYTSVHLQTTAPPEHAVLLLHAFPLSAEMWKPQLSMFEKEGIPAIAPNVFGVNGSKTMPNWTFSDYIQELASLLSSLHIDKVTVVGLSMGGYQAFELWRTLPEKISSMVLCDTKAEQDNEAALASRRDFISAVRARGAQEAVDRMLPNIMATETYTSKPELIETFKEIVNKQSGDVIADTMQAIASRSDSVDTLATINRPVTFITGIEDKLTPTHLAKSMHQHVSGSTLHLVAGAGHLSNMEQPEAFNRHLLDHLKASA
ncbi:MAG: alpha/beta hydrolase [Prosthecochloris sp.]|nr:alpha/beta hydrolase [Prosthecochloris sp.]